MVTIVLAIAFLTYTGLSGKLVRNLALLATSLSETTSVPAAEVRAAARELLAQGILSPLSEKQSLQDFRFWLSVPAGELRDRISNTERTDLRERMEQELQLRIWLDQGARDPSLLPLAVRFRESSAESLLGALRSISALDDLQLQQLSILVSLGADLPGLDSPVRTILSAIEAEELKRQGLLLSTLLRRAGVNIESTLQGGGSDLWIIIMALLLCTVGIANAMLMSVTERFREIGTMKCLGAQDGLVVKLFLLESAFLGVAGAILGIFLGILVSLAAGLLQFHWFAIPSFPLASGLLIMVYALVAGIVLAVAGTLYPAVLAARMKPVDAMRIDE